MRLWCLVTAAVLSVGCGADAAPGDPEPEPPPGPDRSIDVGLPGGEDGLDFVRMKPGETLRLQTFGQGGTHLLLAARCVGFGSRAFVSVTIRNLETGTEIVAPAPPRPQLLYCQEQNCDLVPMMVMTSGIVDFGEPIDGVPVEVEMRAEDAEGDGVAARRAGVLSAEDL